MTSPPPPPVWTDPTGRSLLDYPRPSVAVDTAVLTVAAPMATTGGARSRVSTLLVRAGSDGLRLPGTFLHDGETLAEAVLRSLRDKAGVTGLRPRQLQVFDAPDRDDRGWVLSVAHVDTVPARLLDPDPARAELVPVDDLPALPWGHAAIVERAVESLRSDHADRPDPHALLDEPFTLRELHALHEAVAGATLPRDAFRRAMEGRLTATGDLHQGSVGKPARLFTRAAGVSGATGVTGVTGVTGATGVGR